MKSDLIIPFIFLVLIEIAWICFGFDILVNGIGLSSFAALLIMVSTHAIVYNTIIFWGIEKIRCERSNGKQIQHK